MADRPSTAALQLDELLSGGKLLVAALAILVAAGALYLFGLLGEEATAGAGVVAVTLAAATLMLRGAPVAAPGPRTFAVVAALATVAAVLLAALPTVVPGRPLAEGELGQAGEKLALPAGAHGRVRLLVSGRLPEGGETSVTYAISGPQPEVDGKVERVFRQVRVGRGGRGRAATDHNADWYDAEVPAATAELTLRKVNGQLGSRLHVGVYRPLLPSPYPWVAAVLALGLAAAAEARLGRRNGVAVPAGMALAFGLLVTYNATPVAAVGQVGGGVILGAIAGSVVGWLAGLAARKLLARGAP
ncbi:MAG: hypothetical protein HZB56_12350 [Deltaproteobacteria bacterium]|nr:hypothetical protein [Deltaproteobacteria bacterium]